MRLHAILSERNCLLESLKRYIYSMLYQSTQFTLQRIAQLTYQAR